jgi:hypothetical protein
MVRVAKPDAARTGDATAQPRADSHARRAADGHGPDGHGHGARRPAAHRDRRTAADAASGDGHGAIYGAAYRDGRSAANAASPAAPGTGCADAWAWRAIARTCYPVKWRTHGRHPHCT